ncbi:protein LTV1 homolog [Neodiprion pinetum]|uniref:protein LTV1 homolog n=1 Tax=Neodiprion pinetum TaxID=441929 RepID=UPI001EDDF244|nr:protein LTV1 homolog [Neodiprion pinetum]
MPKGKGRKFIDKKNAVTFHLVHRSQQDPLAADETAPQRVLVPLGKTQATKSEKKETDIAKRKEEQQKYGIFFDDDYDYLQHMRDSNQISVEWEPVEDPQKSRREKNADRTEPKINLPSSVFASDVEEDVGLLNKAAPVSGLRLDVDPEIVAAMDEDFDFEDPDNQLEDNFFELANAEGSDIEFDEHDEDGYESDESDEQYSDVSSEGHMQLSDEEKDQVPSLNGREFAFEDVETKSQFTDYSMSSSVMRRNDQLTLLDNRFEKMYTGYDDLEIGALDCEEIEGHVAPDSDILLQYADEFEKKKKENTENVAKLMAERLRVINLEESNSEDENDLEKLVVDAREKEKWDCESILSTYSNIYNHPKLISEPKGSGKIKINPRTGIPQDVLNSSNGTLTAKTLAKFNLENDSQANAGPRSVAETMKSTLSVLSIRPKDESPEDRKERKKALKEYRKERRLERKANIEAFKEEKKRQEKIMLNNRNNVQGNRVL